MNRPGTPQTAQFSCFENLSTADQLVTDRLRLFEDGTNFLRPQHDLAVQVDVVLREEVHVE